MENFDDDLQNLIYASLVRPLTAEEQKQLDEWLMHPSYRELYRRICDKEKILRKAERMDGYDQEVAWQNLRQKMTAKKKFALKWYYYAASLLLPLLVVGFLFRQLSFPESVKISVLQDVIEPGTQNARIFLADGGVLDLKKDTVYQMVTADGVEIKNVGGFVSFETKDTLLEEERRFNRIETPRGGEYHVVLPDGTKVWLNAESSLRFPVAFAKSERRVFMTGEVYFEVAQREDNPFLVQSSGMTIRVLGTKFNVRAYGDTPSTTTLFSGKVQLNEGQEEVLLAPGQQAVLLADGGGFQVRKADLNATMAWLNGVFIFDNQTLGDIMQELGRWYDVNVFFVNSRLQEERFSVEMPRHESFSEVLRLIEKTGVIHVDVKGRTVLIK